MQDTMYVSPVNDDQGCWSGVNKTRIGSDRIGSDRTGPDRIADRIADRITDQITDRITEKKNKVLKKKKIQKNGIVL